MSKKAISLVLAIMLTVSMFTVTALNVDAEVDENPAGDNYQSYISYRSFHNWLSSSKTKKNTSMFYSILCMNPTMRCLFTSFTRSSRRILI